jgi:DNA-binding transcriptional MerR regulator/methylmalonyl-CoA mutase cobalamin-binding subunit
MRNCLYNLIAMDTSTSELFPIRELVKRTGVNASTLRAWENRHGLLTPMRTPSGHRLYSDADVQRIKRLQHLLAQGLSLGEIVPLLGKEDTTPSIEPLESTPAQSVWHGYLAETIAALEDFSTDRLDLLYNEACALFPIDTITEHLLIPTLEQIGLRWDKRPAGIAEEHFFSAWLRNKLGARLHHAAGIGRGQQLILACLPHEDHELGLLMFALLALQRGYRIIYLGANMPIREIVHVAMNSHAQAIVLAGRNSEEPAKVVAEIAWLARAASTPVFVGSHFSEQARHDLELAGAYPVGDRLHLGMRLLEVKLNEQERVRL